MDGLKTKPYRTSLIVAEDWSDIENDLIIEDYFSMLRHELAGKPINKTAHRNKLRVLLRNRSGPSVEFKHRNISAVLEKFGVPYIRGYKPAHNYQRKVFEPKVADYLESHGYLERDFTKFAESTPEPSKILAKPDFNDLLESAPKREQLDEPKLTYRRPFKRNYLEMEQTNRTLGKLGEQFTVEYEKWRLVKAGKDSLADKIEWVADTRGDGLGFDILSKNTNGTDRYIEVKTTKLTKDSPIFFTRNELKFSGENSKNFYLYRLFNFNVKPKAFILNGQFEDFCRVEPISFQGNF
jgi:hypothetical protein